jgi:hypothetical protein
LKRRSSGSRVRLHPEERILLEAEEAAVRRDHDVIQNFDADEFTRFGETTCELSVLLAGIRVSTWVEMFPNTKIVDMEDSLYLEDKEKEGRTGRECLGEVVGDAVVLYG